MHPGSQKREETSQREVQRGPEKRPLGREEADQDACITVTRSRTFDEVKGVSLRPRADRTVAPVSNIQVTKRTE